MYIDANTIIFGGSLVTAVAALCGIAYKLFKWVEEQKNQTTKLKAVQEEQTMICYALLAALDGLKQLGANGEVTKAHDDLSKYINKKAHDQKER